MMGLVSLTGALSFLLIAPSASALGTTYGATFSGTVNGVDTLGLFGRAGVNLTGSSYTQTFYINTLAGSMHTASNQQDETGSTAAFIDAVLTINGQSVTVHSSAFGEAFVNNGGSVTNGVTGIHSGEYSGPNAYHVVYDYARDTAFRSTAYYAEMGGYASNSNSSALGFPTGLDQAFLVPVGVNGTKGAGFFNVLEVGCDTEVEALHLIETVAAAPEPSTWALLLLGIGSLGLVLRRASRSQRIVGGSPSLA